MKTRFLHLIYYLFIIVYYFTDAITFDSNGRLPQVDYANIASRHGATTIAVLLELLFNFYCFMYL